MKRSFTLVELIVVITIIILIISISAVGIDALLRSGDQTQTLKIFETALANAQTTSNKYGCTVALRVERAFKTDSNGAMVKINGSPVWLNHQQIRFVIRGYQREDNFGGYLGYAFGPWGNFVPEPHGFRNLMDTGILKLPSSFWIAPGPSLTDLDNWNIKWQPSNSNAVPINLFENFYITFNHMGALTEGIKWLYYLDETQHYSDNGLKVPVVEYPYDAVKSVIIYNRERFIGGDKQSVLGKSLWKSIKR